MSIKIRLARTGKKNSPAFRVVVAQTRSKRNGQFLAVLGEFNPAMSKNPVIDTKAVETWVKKGALLTEPVKKMLEGKYTYTKYNPKAQKASEEAGGKNGGQSDDASTSSAPPQDLNDNNKESTE